MEQRRYFYFTRHGQTVWNVENKICGVTDIALTQAGREQARALGKRIHGEGIRIDEILCSPLCRAADTAQEIGCAAGIPVRVEPRLKEQNFGMYEGTPRDGADFARAKQDFICSYGTGESMLRLAQRVYNLLDELRADESGRIYLLVAHNGIARVIHSYFFDMTNRAYASFGIGNCELKTYYF